MGYAKDKQNIIAKLASLEPAARATAIVATLEQLLGLLDSPDWAHLGRTWQKLSGPRETDPPPVLARRKTCGELAAAIKCSIGPGWWDSGKPAIGRGYWQKWIEAFSNSSDPRQSAMAETFRREFGELGGSIIKIEGIDYYSTSTAEDAAATIERRNGQVDGDVSPVSAQRWTETGWKNISLRSAKAVERARKPVDLSPSAMKEWRQDR